MDRCTRAGTTVPPWLSRSSMLTAAQVRKHVYLQLKPNDMPTCSVFQQSFANILSCCSTQLASAKHCLRNAISSQAICLWTAMHADSTCCRGVFGCLARAFRRHHALSVHELGRRCISVMMSDIPATGFGQDPCNSMHVCSVLVLICHLYVLHHLACTTW